MATSLKPPGRLVRSDVDLRTDPRADPHMIKALATVGLDTVQKQDIPGFSRAQLAPIVAKQHAGLDTLYSMPEYALPGRPGDVEVLRTDEIIKTFDGTDMKLHYFRGVDLVNQTLPAILYFHRGGMTTGTTLAPLHIGWVRSLAQEGVLAVLVDFRNAWTENKDYPFPTGQLDCIAALKHVYANKQQLKVSTITLQGESGGGNLALTTALRAKREDFLDHINGVFACIPYISHGALWPRERQLKELPSFVENEGYMLAQGTLAALGWYYGPDDLENPHAWPYYASVEDLKGLPPHMIVVDELDVFRDEGIAYHRKLVQAGVSSTGRINLGTVHGAEFIFRAAVPQMYYANVRGIIAFAKSL